MGWESGASLFTQSQNDVKQNQKQRKLRYTFDTQMDTASVATFLVVLSSTKLDNGYGIGQGIQIPVVQFCTL